jgi:hypothetical protein
MWFDRRISDQMLEALRTGPLRFLADLRNHDPLIDLQLRRASKDAAHCWVSCYVGLTTVLDVHERDGRFWLDAHKTHREAGGFDDAWKTPASLTQLSRISSRVKTYVKTAVAQVDVHHIEFEGKVHAAMCSGAPPKYRVIQREASPSFSSRDVKEALIDELGKPIWDAVRAAPPPGEGDWWPGVRYSKNLKRFGTSPDVLAVDDDGRLLVMEAKPPGALDGITWGPAQVWFYGLMFAELFDKQPEAGDHITGMLKQRISLGLTAPGRTELATPLRIVPVLAIGSGRASRKAIKRATLVQDAINAGAKEKGRVARAEVWLLDAAGEPALVMV